MDYNSALIKLGKEKENIIKQAKQNGYTYTDGQLIKKKTVPVMEMYINTKSRYGSDGNFIFKKTITITQEQLKIIKNVKRNAEDIEDIFAGENIEVNFQQKELKEFIGIIADYGIGYLDKEYISDISIEDDLESMYDYEYPMYLEFEIENKDYISGYVSIYELSANKLDQQDNVCIHLKKNITCD